jgi:hypothetical protein
MMMNIHAKGLCLFFEKPIEILALRVLNATLYGSFWFWQSVFTLKRAQACSLKHCDCIFRNHTKQTKTYIAMKKNTQTKTSQIEVLIEDEGGLDFITVKIR